MEHAALLANIQRYVNLTSEEQQSLISICKIRKIKRRQYIIQPGFVCQYRTYIIKGAFKVFYLDERGKEHTVSIGIEDWFVTDFYSYIHQEPAINFAEALEDSIIIQMHYNDIESLCKKCHAISEYFRLTTEKAFAHSRRRVISNISKPAADRYKDYVTKYPQIAQRVPQYVIASYLGISPEFLSKSRKTS